MNGARWIEDARALTVAEAARLLGVTTARAGMACPACQAARRGKRDKRPPATFGARGWRCWSCSAAGDALDLVSYSLTGRKLSADHAQQTTVRAWLVDQGITAAHDQPSRPRLRAIPAEPPPSDDWPERGEVDRFWAACRPVADDPACLAWLTRRYGEHAGRIVALLDHLSAARSIPTTTAARFARFGGRRWSEAGYRLIFPLSDADGQIRSVRARDVSIRADNRQPKAVPATGYGCRGLILACDRARAMLSGAPLPASWPPGRLPRVTVVEGETDWMAWLSRRHTMTDPALIGVYSGGWIHDHAAALPHGTILTVRTDDNAAGHRYAEGIARTIEQRRDLTLLRAGIQ